jgi:hypothetical protein
MGVGVSDPEGDGGGLGIGEDDIATKSGRNLTKDLGAIDRIWPWIGFGRQEVIGGLALPYSLYLFVQTRDADTKAVGFEFTDEVIVEWAEGSEVLDNGEKVKRVGGSVIDFEIRS